MRVHSVTHVDIHAHTPEGEGEEAQFSYFGRLLSYHKCHLRPKHKTCNISQSLVGHGSSLMEQAQYGDKSWQPRNLTSPFFAPFA